MGNSCSSVKLYLEKKVAGSITKRTLAKDAKPSAEPKNVTAQLTAQFKLWLRDETKGLTIDESKKPMLSRIFLWYAGDFETRGGSPAYAAQYAPAGAARDALATTAPDYFAYDWNLNTQ